jgi:hypothetical protein
MTLPLSKAEAHCTTAVTPLLQLISGRDCIRTKVPHALAKARAPKRMGPIYTGGVSQPCCRTVTIHLGIRVIPPVLNSCSTRRREPRQRALNTAPWCVRSIRATATILDTEIFAISASCCTYCPRASIASATMGSWPAPTVPRASQRPANYSVSLRLPPTRKSRRITHRKRRVCCPAHARTAAPA